MRRLIVAVLLAPVVLLAEFSYSETSRMTGGALVNMSRSLGGLSKTMRKIGEPQVTTVYVKGNRMARISDTSGQIIDLDKETMTQIDFEKKTWSTITFAQMKEAMEKAMQKAQGKMKEAEPERKKAAEQAEMNVKFDVKETGKTQTISGLNTKEVVMTITMEATDKKSGQSGAMDTMSSIWVTSDPVPGYDEYKAFTMKMAQKMAGSLMSGEMRQQAMAMGGDPRMRVAMEKMAKESEKLQGFHVRQITKMGTGLDPAKASEISDPNAVPQGPTAGELAGKAAEKETSKEAIAGRIGRIGGLGGLGGLGRGRKAKEEKPKEEAQAQTTQQAQANSGVLMEMVVESGNFSRSVDASKMAPPAGFQQVEDPMLKQLR